MVNMEFFKEGFNVIQHKISQYDNENILDFDIEEIADRIVSEISIPTNLQLSTDKISSTTRFVDIPTDRLPIDMRISAKEQFYKFVAIDYHITAIGNMTLFKLLPIMQSDNVSVDGNCITLTLVLNYVRLELPDEKIREVKLQLKQWLQRANQEISALLDEIIHYNSSLKEYAMSELKEIQNKQRRMKEQNNNLCQLDK